MDLILILLAMLASVVGNLATSQIKAQSSICQETDKPFLMDVYVGTPAENAARIKLFTDSGAGSAALVSYADNIYLMTAGHVAWHAETEEMSIYVPGCGVLREIVNPDKYLVLKFASDNIMLYPIDSETMDALAGIADPLTISLEPTNDGDTIYFPTEGTADLLPYFVVTVNDFELYSVMWNDGDEVCESMSGSPVFDANGNIIGVLSSAPTMAESNTLTDCFVQAYVIPIGHQPIQNNQI